MAAAHGVDSAAILSGTGLTLELLEDPEVVLQAVQELLVARNLVARLGDLPGLGAEAGRLYNVSSMGILGLALLSSATVRDVLHTVLHFISLSSSFVQFDLRERGAGGVLLIRDDDIPADIREFMVERDVAAVLAVSTYIFGVLQSAPHDVRAELCLPKARCQELAVGAPLAVVERSTTTSRITFARRLLDQAMPAGDPATAKMFVRQCEELLQRRRELGGIASQVRALLVRNLRTNLPIAEVADALNLTERTLRRHLADEGTSYRRLLEETRETLASELLRTTCLSVEQIASQLGYAESASFTRAFVRWRGTSPGRYRKVSR